MVQSDKLPPYAKASLHFPLCAWSKSLNIGTQTAGVLLLSICELIRMREGLSIVRASSRCLEAVVETVSPILETQGRKEAQTMTAGVV